MALVLIGQKEPEVTPSKERGSPALAAPSGSRPGPLSHWEVGHLCCLLGNAGGGRLGCCMCLSFLIKLVIAESRQGRILALQISTVPRVRPKFGASPPLTFYFACVPHRSCDVTGHAALNPPLEQV